MTGPTLVVEGRHFDGLRPIFAMAFAQSLADEYEREVVVYEQTPGGPKLTRERVKPTWKPGDKL